MPDLGGFEMATQIESTVDGRVILWFFRIDRDRGLWIQVQVTLVGASLKRANLEILQAMPKIAVLDAKNRQHRSATDGVQAGL
jgi:hypothetical protein